MGPVFLWEWRRVSRQWWFYAMRAAIMGGLLAELAAAWWAFASRPNLKTHPGRCAGRRSLLHRDRAGTDRDGALAAPAVTAGIFGMEKARGHVCLMLITEVNSLDIVLGIVLARLLPVLGGVPFRTVPVLALTSHLGGVPPSAMVDLLAVTVGTAALGCTLALALSVAARRFHEVLVATYVLLAGWSLGYPILMIIRMTAVGGLIYGSWVRWLRDVNPFWIAMAPILRPGSSRSIEVWAFLGGTLALAAVLAGLAAWRLRPAAVNDRGPARRWSWRRRLTLDGWGSMLEAHPIYWRECRLQRPLTWISLLTGLYVAGALLFSILALIECATRAARGTTVWAGPFNGFQAAVGLLLLSLVTPASLAEDRARGSLEVLLLTPLSSRSLLLEKWFAHYRVVPWLAVLPGVVAGGACRFERAMARRRAGGRDGPGPGRGRDEPGDCPGRLGARLDRALTLSAAVAVFFTVAWIPLMLLFFRDDRALGIGLAAASPLYGVGFLTSEIVRRFGGHMGPGAGWSAVLGRRRLGGIPGPARRDPGDLRLVHGPKLIHRRVYWIRWRYTTAAW